jgi:hypothetical protein
MRLFVSCVVAFFVAVAGCSENNPDHPIDSVDNCGCIDGWVCCNAHLCAPTAAQCTSATPDMAPPDISPPPSGTISFDVESASFGDTIVGTTSPVVPVHVSNLGADRATIVALNFVRNDVIVPGGDFKILKSSSCTIGSSLGFLESCRLDLQFAPTQAGNEQLSLAVDTPNAENLLPLAGNGTASAPLLAADPAQFTFTDAPLSPQDSSLFVLVNNKGMAPTGVLTVDVLGRDANVFSASGCAVQLPVGGTCELSITFSPTQQADFTATVKVSDGTPAGTLQIPVSGNGGIAAGLTLTGPGAFPDQWMGQSSPQQTIHVSNSGQKPSGAISVSNPSRAFVIDRDDCTGVSLGSGNGCDISIHFVALLRGNNQATLTVSASPGGSVSAFLQGRGKQHATIGTWRTSLTFNTKTLARAYQTVSLTNSGDEDANLSYALASGSSSPFDLIGCGVVSANSTCWLLVGFGARTAGTYTDTLTISGAAGTPLSVALTGVFAPVQLLVPNHDSFNVDNVHTTYAFPVVFTNVSAQTLGPLTATMSGSGYSLLTDTCSNASIASGASCTVTPLFTPTFTGTFPGTLTVGDGTNTTKVALTVNAVLPAFSFNPTTLNFGNIGIGQASPATSVVVTNISNRDAPTGYTIDNTNFWVVGSDCPATLTVGSSCTMSLRFGPRTAGNFSGTLTFGGTEGTPTLALGGIGQ